MDLHRLTQSPTQTPLLDADEQWYEDNAEGFVAAGMELRESLIAAASKPPRVATDRKTMVSIRLHQYAVGDLVNIHEAKNVLR